MNSDRQAGPTGCAYAAAIAKLAQQENDGDARSHRRCQHMPAIVNEQRRTDPPRSASRLPL